MQPTYFASFWLGEPDNSVSVALPQVTSVIETWIFGNPKRSIRKPDSFDPSKEGDYDLGDGASLRVRYLNVDEYESKGELWAARYEHPDLEKRLWRTDIVVDATKRTELGVRCSVGVAVGSTQQILAPLGSVASRPRIVPTLIQEFGAYDAYPLRVEHIAIRDEDVELFIQLLVSPDRRLPIVFVTGRNFDGSSSTDVTHLANQLSGIAYVCVTDSTDVTFALRDSIGNELNAYDGAVRIYWPGFSTSDPPYRHKLWVHGKVEAADQVGGGFARQLLRTLSRLSTSRHMPGFIRWEDVQRRRLLQSASNATDEAELKELLHLALEENDGFAEKIEALRSELEAAQQEVETERAQADQWRQAYQEARSNQTLGSSDVTQVEQTVSSVEEAVELAREQYSDCLEFTGPAVKKEVRLYEQPSKVLKALTWLATTYRDAKKGEYAGIDLDVSCRTEAGFWFKANQSEITMTTYPGDYKVLRNGKTFWLDEHIGSGSGTDPRHNIRVAFLYDAMAEKVVVGFIGQHQKTKASN